MGAAGVLSFLVLSTPTCCHTQLTQYTLKGDTIRQTLCFASPNTFAGALGEEGGVVE